MASFPGHSALLGAWNAPLPFAGGGTSTQLHPAAVGILVVGILLLWLLPRRYMLVPFVAITVLIPLQQQVVVFGLHFMVLRIVILCAWIRVLFSLASGPSPFGGKLWTVDKLFCLWVLWAAIAYTLLWADSRALITKLGFLYNAFGIYYLFRLVVSDHPDVKRLIRTFAGICVVLAFMMVVEQATGRNLLAVFGAPAESEVRQGHIRAQGPFAHAIIAGTFGAMLAPVFAGLWWAGNRGKAFAGLGFIAATLIAFTSASSTPIAAYMAGMLGMFMWSFRRYMRAVLWAAVAAAVGLHMVMKAPVWALLNRVDLVGGSTGWHRFLLVDECIHHFGEWWLIGTASNPSWGYGTWDTANWYVGSCVSGGLLALLLFLAIIASAFRTVGRRRRACQDDVPAERLVWGLGAALFTAAVSFVGITLFDQSIVAWYALLALVGAMRFNEKTPHPVPPVTPDHTMTQVDFALTPETSGRR